MNIAILGGTGKEGAGLALRWAQAGHSIIIGSRDAERARTLFVHTPHATLATVAVEPAGYPFGSLVGHAVDDAGNAVKSLGKRSCIRNAAK